MGQRAALGGHPNSGKSYGRRYIPDGENVMIIAPSVKAAHLFESMPGIWEMTSEQIDKAIVEKKRKPVKAFDIVSPEGKYKNIQEAIMLPAEAHKQNIVYLLSMLSEKKKPEYFGKDIKEMRKHIKGNIILCDNLENLQMMMAFVNVFMPWIHTIILPDFTHYITEVITSTKFRNRRAKDESFARYIDLAADSLRSFIKYSDVMRHEVITITEFHTEWSEPKNSFTIFTPGGKMLTEKFLPASYYDTFLFTDVKFDEDKEDADPEYRYVTRKTARYPEARSIGVFDELYIPNNLQIVLDKIREYNGIELPATK